MTSVQATLRACACALALLATAAAAQCPGNQVLVGEDADNYYCMDRRGYAACVGAAGQELRRSNPACAQRVGDCFRHEQMPLTVAGLDCVIGCAKGGFLAATCARRCLSGGIKATKVLEACGVDLTNRCFEEALLDHRRRMEACKE